MAETPKNPQSSSPTPSSSTLKTFLISSVNFWFSISVASSTLSLAFLFSTTTPFKTPLALLSITLHSLIFLYHNRMRVLMELLKHKPLLCSCIFIPLFCAAAHLSRSPYNDSIAGLFFSICITVDALAVIQIIRPTFVTSVSLYFISTVAVDRAGKLYGIWGSVLMYGFTAGVVGLNCWLDQAIKDSNKKIVEGINDKDHQLNPTTT